LCICSSTRERPHDLDFPHKTIIPRGHFLSFFRPGMSFISPYPFSRSELLLKLASMATRYSPLCVERPHDLSPGRLFCRRLTLLSDRVESFNVYRAFPTGTFDLNRPLFFYIFFKILRTGVILSPENISIGFSTSPSFTDDGVGLTPRISPPN